MQELYSSHFGIYVCHCASQPLHVIVQKREVFMCNKNKYVAVTPFQTTGNFSFVANEKGKLT